MGVLLLFLNFCSSPTAKDQEGSVEPDKTKILVKLMVLDPGHFHAALVQKKMYAQVDSVVHVYAPEGPDVQDYLNRIKGYNSREIDPTHWEEKVYTGPDFFEKMIRDKPGNVMIVSGNNAKKTEYINAAIEAGIHVLADKPMAITPEDYSLLHQAFETAREKGVFLYDIMTERYEINTILQKSFSRMPEIFGTLKKGSSEDPAITKESVHHFFKYVSGKPIKRPAWFFDVEQQGEGVVDIATHLVDMVQWECFPSQVLDHKKDVKVLSAKRWPTKLSPAQFAKVTGQEKYPDYLKKDVGSGSFLSVFSNGEINFILKGIHARVSVTWNFQAPEGTGDTHFSKMRGTKADLVIRQGKDQDYRPALYIKNTSGLSLEEFERNLRAGIRNLNEEYPGIGLKKDSDEWEILIPNKFKVGHEAHFAQVTEKFLMFLAGEELPEWEVPNMLAKYFTTTQAYEMSRPNK